MLVATEFARQHGKQVLVVTQPYELGKVGERHIEQQREMAAMLQRRFGGDPMVPYVNLGTTVDLLRSGAVVRSDASTAEGNRRVARVLVEPVVAMASRHGEPGAGPTARDDRRVDTGPVVRGVRGRALGRRVVFTGAGPRHRSRPVRDDGRAGHRPRLLGPSVLLGARPVGARAAAGILGFPVEDVRRC